MLPSFYYLAGFQEFPYGSLCLPWDPPQLDKNEADKEFAIGLWAREQGAHTRGWPSRILYQLHFYLIGEDPKRKHKEP